MRGVENFVAISLLLLSFQGVTTAMADDDVLASEAVSASLGVPLSDADLSANRGGSALQISGMDLDSNLLDNQAMANVTGNNFVTEGALTSASGFSTVVQNSGNNVIIQSATIVNLSVH